MGIKRKRESCEDSLHLGAESRDTMEGVYNVQENVNFENFLKVMGVTDEATIEKMINATKQGTLTANQDGTWTQVSGLKTLTFPVNTEFKDSWGDKELTGYVTMEGAKMTKVFKLDGNDIFSEEVLLDGNNLTLTLIARDGTKAVRKMVRS